MEYSQYKESMNFIHLPVSSLCKQQEHELQIQLNFNF